MLVDFDSPAEEGCEDLTITRTCTFDDICRQLLGGNMSQILVRNRDPRLNADRRSPGADELFVWTNRGFTLLPRSEPSVVRPEAARVRGESFIDDYELPFGVASEFELGISNDEAALLRIPDRRSEELEGEPFRVRSVNGSDLVGRDVGVMLIGLCRRCEDRNDAVAVHKSVRQPVPTHKAAAGRIVLQARARQISTNDCFERKDNHALHDDGTLP